MHGTKKSDLPNQRSSEASAGIAPDYKLLFESAPNLYLVLDPQLRIVGVSKAYAKATMTQAEKITGRSIFDVFPENPQDRTAAGVRNLRASLKHVLQSRVADPMPVQRYDIQRPKEEGEGFVERYWSPLNSPVLDADGNLRYIIHRVEDVTDFIHQKQQEKYPRTPEEMPINKSQRLEAEIAQRTRDVAERSAQLKTANDELTRLYAAARELDDIKTRFFANVSHELRIPLTLILAPLGHMMADPALSQSHRRQLTRIERNARVLLQHVNDLLDFAKINAREMHPVYSQIDLAHLARLAASNFEVTAMEHRIGFDIDIPRNLMAQVDPDKVQRILINLLSNAFKFVPDGGKVGLRMSSQRGDGVIVVQDNGPGVLEEMRDAIFERFRQIETSEGLRPGGTGLGLAIVKEFVHLHHGAVAVETAPGGGALFTVRLPLTAPPDAQVDTVSDAQTDNSPQRFEENVSPPAIVPAPQAAMDAPLVLVVEDNPDMSAFIAETLGPHYRIKATASGKAALEMALASRPDLILSDVMVRDMRGDRMVEAIRSHRELDDTAIIMITANHDEDLRVRLFQSGIQDFLYKPFSINELLARIGGLLSEQRKRYATQEQLAAIVESTTDAIIAKNLDGVITHWNGAAEQLFGYQADEAIGKSIMMLIPEDRRNEEKEILAHIMRGEKVGHFDTVRLRKDGQPVSVSITISPIRNHSGKVVGASKISRDITEQKRTEAEIRALNAHLERRVEERTAELQAANRELDAFAYAVSHDLRAPLRAMNGFAQALKEDYGARMDSEALDYLDEIRLASHKMGKLIDGLLALSRMTRGELCREEVDLSALASRIRTELSHSEPDRLVHWQIEPGMLVNGDSRMLSAVVENLLGNAWKYTSRTPVPEIRFFSEPDQDGCRFCVADNGAGFDMAYAQRLFQPFQRLHRQDEFPGIGIGLATVKRIIHRHGGEITAVATPGQGACFCFSIGNGKITGSRHD